MPHNKKLEKNQRKAYKNEIAKYTFQCEGAGVKSKEKPKITAIKKGIRLHFLRYGLFYKDDYDEISVAAPKAVILKNKKVKQANVGIGDAKKGVKLDEVEVLSVKSIPKANKFYTARTALSKGYIYLINDKDPDDYYELEVDELGMLSHILWEYNKDEKGNYLDIRKSTNEKILYKVVEPGKKLWFTYSPIQWSRKYHNELNTNAEKRKKHMTLINCSGFKKGEKSPNKETLPYYKVNTVFSNNQPYANSFECLLHEIHADEKKQDEKGNNDILEDMFIVAHDPIGCAMDITNTLSKEIIRHKALLESIQTGSDVNSIFKRMLAGKSSPKLTSEQQQIGAMVHLALTQYQLVYNSQDMIDDYDGGRIGWGGGIYKEKLVNTLGVKERKAQRQVIRNLRNNLGSFLDSDYYKNAFRFFDEGTRLNTIDGKFLAMQPYRILAIKPHTIDRTYDLKKHFEKDDNWDGLIKNSLKPSKDNSLNRVINKEINLDEDTIKQGIDLANKIAGFIIASLETYADFAVKDVVVISWTESITKQTVKGNYKLIVNRLEKIKVHGEDMFQVRGYEVRKKLESAGWEIDKGKVVAGKYKGKKDIYRWVRAKSPELVLKESIKGRHIFDIPVTKEVAEVTRIPQRRIERTPTDLGKKANALLNGAPFRGVVALLQVFNIGAAYHSFSQEGSLKNTINLVGIGSEFVAASGYFIKSSFSKNLTTSLAGRISIYSGLANFAGAGITVIMCGWDAYLSFDARDHNAAIAWTGAAAVFSVAAFEAGMATFASGALFGPAGAICAGIGVGLVFLAYYLKDSPLETFFKNNIFSDEVDLKKNNNELTWKYNKRLYSLRNKVNPDSDYRKWNDFKLAGADLTDLLVCSNIEIKAHKLIKESSGWQPMFSPHASPTKISTGHVLEYKVAVSFRQFLHSEDQLAYKVYFYKNGIKNGNGTDMNITIQAKIEKGTKKEPPKALVNFRVHEKFLKQYTNKSQILFVCALAINEDKFYPSRYNNDTRFLGAFSNTYHTSVETYHIFGSRKTNHMYNSNVAIKTLEELKSGNAWR